MNVEDKPCSFKVQERTFTYDQMKKCFESPAIKIRSQHYPGKYKDKVPLVIKMGKTVTSDLPKVIEPAIVQVDNRKEYPVWVNSHGAVAAILSSGMTLGLKPDEFEVIEWHQ